MLPDTMPAINIAAPGGPEVLQPLRLPLPQTGDDQVLVEVRAAGVNRPDILQRIGSYAIPPDASPLPGLEICGIVRQVGEDVSRWSIGDRVMALTHGGGYAGYCAVHADHCLPAPEGLSDVEAAAVPETFFTVWYNVFTRGGLQRDEVLLLHGGSSGIGTTAIQLANAFGASVLTTAGSADKCRFCEKLGARLAINYREQDWVAAVREATDGVGPDVILDMVAGRYMQKNIDLLARDGRYVIIAFLDGASAELNLRAVLGKRLTITGSTLRPQSVAEKAAIATDLAEKVLPLLQSGAVRPVIDSTFRLQDASEAHRRMESSQHIGKIVLTLDPEDLR